MNIKQIFFEALEQASTDISIENGIFDISKQEHIEILREYLFNSNIDHNIVNQYLNKMLEGKYPERQAYNTNGILVTFPTPEYKQKAIARGTHFEENPKRGQANVFTTTEYTLEEALKYGFYNKRNSWFDSSGDYVGKLWNVDGKKLIIK